MAGHEYLDKAGLSTLWDRMRQYVYECCCGNNSGETSGGVRYLNFRANAGTCNGNLSYGEVDISFQEVLDALADGKTFVMVGSDGTYTSYTSVIEVTPYSALGCDDETIYHVYLTYWDSANQRITNQTFHSNTMNGNLRSVDCWACM